MFFYNNTILTETSAGSSSNVHWRNNLMLPQNAAPWGVAAVDANRPNTPELGQRKYAALADDMRESKQDQHSVILDYDALVNVPRLDAKDLVRVQRLYKASDLDFRLKPGSTAVDRGTMLPNITDGFTGQAPDLGALEVGQPAPVYGPRPR